MSKTKINNELLIRKRIEAGLSPDEVAEACGVSYRAYKFYESGTSNPHPATLVKLSELLNFTIDEIITPISIFSLTGINGYAPAPYFEKPFNEIKMELLNPQDFKDKATMMATVPHLQDAELFCLVFESALKESFPPGCVIGIRESKKYVYGRAYLIITEDSGVLLRVIRSHEDEDKVRLHSDESTGLEPIEVLKKDILKSYIVLGCIYRKIA